MLARQRQERILAEVRQHGGARVSDLVDLLGVSDMTIRRDIEVLARRELVVRVHGGATAVDERSSDEPGFAAKSGLALEEKAAIAAAAARLVHPGASVALSAGTTTYQVASQLVEVENLTVVTNSPPAADLLHSNPAAGRTVVLTGGTRTPSDALVGPVAVKALQDLHVDTLVLGVHGLDERAGLTTPNLAEAETNQALVASARRLVVVADHTKWNVVGLAGIAPLERVDVMVTDAGLPQEARRTLAAIVGELVVVDVPTARGAAS
ncbi:DeoR/GlpR family DNA-binding transcription regulator [Angustibacter sp. Root456]|uniref:DeoR/GlpR family DNA-binding transcription regulator n=1 Tax=Angustibacter sp. Root456 TaxID=1736539 RepID=UPI0006F5FBAB|nr:DeoR/GlpR family DNA-binding transcription regulator [Angustibacter sp. Root456]KQX70012.1 cytochrome C [Angustibacter sp. Root456]